MSRHFSMLRDFHFADFFTLANGASGTASMLVSMAYLRDGEKGKLYMAGVFIFLALIFDIFDGRIARWRHKASPLGRELDSLADVISFGVAPAALAYAVGLDGIWDQAILLFFVACGISRLARYNVTAENMAAETGKVTFFEGAPIPSSVLLVVLMVALAEADRISEQLPGGVRFFVGHAFHPIILLFAVSGALMVSKTVRIPKP